MYVLIFQQDCLDSQTKAVFIVTSLITGITTKQIERIIRGSDFQHTTIFSLASPPLLEFIASLHHHQGAHKAIKYGDLEKLLTIWMGNEVSYRSFTYITANT